MATISRKAVGERQLFVIIIRVMKRVNQLKQSFDRIVSSPHPLSIKKLQLEAILNELKIQASVKKDDNNESTCRQDLAQTSCTAISQLSIFSNSCQSSRILPPTLTGGCELQAHILSKQRIKFTLNEEIENCEDQYLRLQGKLLAQREKMERLDQQIARTTYRISKNPHGEHHQEEQPQSLASRIWSFFHI